MDLMLPIILKTPDMALRFAEILFYETQAPRQLAWFHPLTVEDQDDIWSVSGWPDPNWEPPLHLFDDQLENFSFYMHVVKQDAEVKDCGIGAAPKLPPEAWAQFRAVLEAEGETVDSLRRKMPRSYAPDIWMNEVLHGGVINSTDAAVRFGQLVFENHVTPMGDQIKEMRAELIDGIWRVHGRMQSAQAKLVPRRENAQVIPSMCGRSNNR